MNLIDIPFLELHSKLKCKSNSAASFKLQQWKTSDVIDLIGNGLCAYTGKEFDSLSNATFERVNPTLGYVPGNVVMVRHDANSHKSQLDAFVKGASIPDEMKIKLLRKALYQLEKRNGNKAGSS